MINKYYLCSLLLFLRCSCIIGGGPVKKNILEVEKEILDTILNSTSYDDRVRPLENGDVMAPTKISVNMFVLMINRIDDMRMQYNAQFFLRQKWVDPRLKYDSSGGRVKTLNLFEEKIWTPDLFISNERSGYINNLMKPNRFIRIYPDGTVFSSARLSLVLACPMDFRMFPFDTQICSIRFESYGFTTEDVVYQWKEDNPVMVAENLDFSHYTLQKLETKTRHIAISTGNYVSLTVDFYLKRKLTHHMLHLFIPTMLLVVMSWVTFWLDHQCVMTRLFAVLTTLLVLGYKVSDFNATLTPVSYTKSVDVWTITCVLFVFAAMLEVSVVDYRWRHMQKRQRRATEVLETTEDENSVNIDLKPLVSNTSSNATETFQQLTRVGRLRNFFCRRVSALPTGPKRLDIISRYLFPLSFVLFNIFYWFINMVCYAL